MRLRRVGATSHDGGADERRWIAPLPAERLVIARTPPRHRSGRMLRITAAVAGLACAAVLSVASVVLMGMAMASG
ncbi:hypothetical protein [Streptomyces viridochromogenes]|uniref:hypothetical protein n=1 Tax=Streptomyces viridochromogenes TaxID=1938 RepID=UPI0006C2845D|nr:hypothetical protein [Streptomyces viridochromogenes]KOG21216.1 hypothetical protein ADK35_16730 [Streptomyces viridochromogenes]KOG22903.1 hypothetical protein ADK36_10425 [Streptomyces viridochromogenes]